MMARYMRLDVCTNYILYIQNALSSSMDVLSRASEENLLDSGNSIYLRSQLTIERQLGLVTSAPVGDLDLYLWVKSN